LIDVAHYTPFILKNVVYLKILFITCYKIPYYFIGFWLYGLWCV